ncbi:agrin-like [Saccostrea echinata]|uniref:agrin-like n=1 Tax=Saccostrea echinata TaxID=191078 RepID=UPI002A829E3D|nr:agrin-like [Saccostrea echinata]
MIVSRLGIHGTLFFSLFVRVQGCYVYPEGKRDPCQNKTCHFYGRCIPSDDGRLSVCVCPQYCYDYGDNVDNEPVCGSNNVDYPNLCSFQKAACETQKNMTFTIGKCDRCKDLACTSPQVCIVDPDTGIPRCGCVQKCEDRMAQVCGTDGRQYSNRCMLELQACQSRQNIKVKNEGPCEDQLIDGEYKPMSEGPCASVRCYYGSCRIDNRNQPVCDCEPECPDTGPNPVCGSDGQNYSSECQLRKHSCRSGKLINKIQDGPCAPIPESCHTKQCGQHQRCVEENGRVVCMDKPCKNCLGEQFKPVCGSNGASYDNMCELQKANCTTGIDNIINLQHYGYCAKDGCGDLKGACEYYGVCNGNGQFARCMCPDPSDCWGADSKICGSDHKTYDSECMMKVKSCKERRVISVTSVGECTTCQEECQFFSKCMYGRCECDAFCSSAGPPVCTIDGQRFNNKCEMERNVCQNRRQLKVVDCEPKGCKSDYHCLYYGQCINGVCCKSDYHCLYYGQCINGVCCKSDYHCLYYGQCINGVCQCVMSHVSFDRL